MISKDWTIRLYLAIGCLAGAALPARGQPQGVNYDQVALLKWSPNRTVSVKVDPLPTKMIFDGENIWVSSLNDGYRGSVKKIRASGGAVLQTIYDVASPTSLVFDGSNIWVTGFGDSSLTKLRVSDGKNLGTYHFYSRDIYPFDSELRGLAFDGENVWALGSSSVSKVRASDGVRLSEIRSWCGSSYWDQRAVFDRSHLWAAPLWESTYCRIAPGSTDPWTWYFIRSSSPKSTVEDQINGLAFDGASSLWVASTPMAYLPDVGGMLTNVRTSDNAVLGSQVMKDQPLEMIFDGINLWVAISQPSDIRLERRRSSDGALLETLDPNIPWDLGNISAVAFDGTHIWVALEDGTLRKI